MAKYGYNKVKFMHPNYNVSKDQYEKLYDSFIEKYDGMLETKAGKVKTTPLKAFEILCFNAQIEGFIHGDIQGSRGSAKNKDTKVDGGRGGKSTKGDREVGSYFRGKSKKVNDSKKSKEPDWD